MKLGLTSNGFDLDRLVRLGQLAKEMKELMGEEAPTLKRRIAQARSEVEVKVGKKAAKRMLKVFRQKQARKLHWTQTPEGRRAMAIIGARGGKNKKLKGPRKYKRSKAFREKMRAIMLARHATKTKAS